MGEATGTPCDDLITTPAERMVTVSPAHDGSKSVPVTAKLSRKFYEKLGDDVANELVEWFNQVDATYRGELRELNELNFARFDAKLEQRITEVKGALGNLESRLEARLSAFETRIIRWMFVFWVGTLGTLIALRHL